MALRNRARRLVFAFSTCFLGFPAMALGMGMGGGGAGQTGPQLGDPAFAIALPNRPGRLAVRPGGGIVVLLPRERELREYDSAGNLVWKLGVGGRPLSVGALSGGDVLVGFENSREVARFDRSGLKTGIFGKGPGELWKPNDIAVDHRLQRVYVVDSGRDCVRAFRWNGEALWTSGSKGSGEGEFDFPFSADVDPSTGEVFVVDTGNHRVVCLDRDGAFRYSIGVYGDGEGEIFRPAGVALEGGGRVLVSDGFQSWVQAFDRAGTYLGWFAGYAPEAGGLRNPGDIAVDESNRLLVSSLGTGRIEVFTNRAGGAATLPRDPLPELRPAGVSFPEGVLDPAAAPFFVRFRVDLPGVDRNMVVVDGVRLNGSLVPVRWERWEGEEAGVYAADFRREDVAGLVAAGQDAALLELSGVVVGGDRFAGTTRVVVLSGTEPAQAVEGEEDSGICGGPGGAGSVTGLLVLLAMHLLVLRRRARMDGGRSS